MSDRVSNIIDYESGLMTREEIFEFFQELIDDGSCWEMQGHYGRMAESLIDSGLCRAKEKTEIKNKEV